MPLFSEPDDLLKNPLWNRFKIRLKRLINEGFGEFVLSIALLTLGFLLVRTYWMHYQTLQNAVKREILETVRSPQEPADAAKQLGLIAAALAKVNRTAKPDPNGGVIWTCQKGDPPCEAEAILQETFANRAAAMLANEERGKEVGLAHFPMVPANAYRPELADGPLCLPSSEAEKTSLLLPVQMSSLQSSNRVRAAIAVSSQLTSALREIEAKFGKNIFEQLVQAYFISPDSVLRIWNSRQANACQEFSMTRLWASKSYFAFFWEHPEKNTYATFTYIDYGGNGLVRTHCRVVEDARSKQRYRFQNGELIGALCVDLKVPDQQRDKLLHQLFFETAFVSFQLADSLDRSLITVVVEDSNGEQPGPQSGRGGASQSTEIRAGLAGDGAKDSSKATGKGDSELSDEDAAIRMQRATISPGEVQQALREELKGKDTKAIDRDITQISFRGEPAFLVPTGSPPGSFQGIFFYPRSPEIRWSDSFFGAAGIFLLGMAGASAIYSKRLRTKGDQLRERLGLLRNLQVGIVQVDQNDWILECNDRAEELFGRQLPKPGVTRVKTNFQNLIELRLRKTESRLDGEQAESRYEEITADDILKLRSKGQSSSYYARLYGSAQSKWLQISATPMMHAHDEGRKGSGIRLSNILASVHEVSSDIAMGLENFAQSLNARRRAAGAE